MIYGNNVEIGGIVKDKGKYLEIISATEGNKYGITLDSVDSILYHTHPSKSAGVKFN